MIATSKIKMDLANSQGRINIDTVQDDRCSRCLQISLYTGGTAFVPPENTAVVVHYTKPDGTGGSYDTLPDGTTAWNISGNTVTVMLAPQVCTVSGPVELTVSLLWGGAQLSCFGIRLQVHPRAGSFAKSQDYIRIAGLLTQPISAKVGQYLKVAAVENGGISALTAGFLTGSISAAGSSGAPDYVVEEANRLADVVQSRQNGNTVTFLAWADAHHSVIHEDAAQMTEGLLHCAQAMEIVRQRLHVDFAAMLGDLLWDDGETASEAIGAMAHVNSAFSQSHQGLPNFRTSGECDWGPGLTAAQVFARTGIYNTGAAWDPDRRAGGYCYRDFPEHRLRVILLNTDETGTGSFSLSDAQLQWFADALDLSALGEGWQSLVLSHHPLDWAGSTHDAVQALASAENVLCCVHGHTHNFLTGTVAGTGLVRVAVPNACFHRSNEYAATDFGQEQAYEKTAGSCRDTAFCVITLDRETGTVWADHYGAGYSRAVQTQSAAESHSITCDLTGVHISTVPATADHGAAFTAWLTVEEGWDLQSVSVTMGGSDVTGDVYDGSRIAIGAVTGDLVITALAVDPNGPVNLVSTSIDTDGTIFRDCGYISNYRLQTNGNMALLSGAITSGFIPYQGEVITISGSASATVGSTGNYLGLYDGNFTRLLCLNFSNFMTGGAQWQQDGTYQLVLDPASVTNASIASCLESAAYLRCSLTAPASADAFCVTLT